ncbi:MAG: protein translocase subunit SecF [Candidatus Woesearchaeota archaeon]
MGIKDSLIDFYDKKYKLLTIIPVIIFILAAISIGYKYQSTGDFINRGVSLKGGVSISVPTEKQLTEPKLEQIIRAAVPELDVSVRKLTSQGNQIGFLIEADALTKDQIEKLQSAVEKEFEVKRGQYSLEQIGSSLGESFFKETFVAIFFTFMLMAITVFIYFREPLPCLAVIFAALADIVVTVATINFIGIKISTAGIAALLMMIGYSVDTDVLLTARVLKRSEGSILERTLGAMRTGLMMTFTAIAAVVVGLMLTNSSIIYEMMLVLFIGLVLDIVNTWFTNAGMLRWYVESKMKVHNG